MAHRRPPSRPLTTGSFLRPTRFNEWPPRTVSMKQVLSPGSRKTESGAAGSQSRADRRPHADRSLLVHGYGTADQFNEQLPAWFPQNECVFPVLFGYTLVS